MNTQAQFFQRLRPSVPPYSSLVAAVATTLQVSMDSAYRRIRGEKLLNFEEISLLCQDFNISLDEFLCLKTNSILFKSSTLSPKADPLAHWMEEMIKQLNYINGFPKRHLYFLIKDLPPFHHFLHPTLARFKIFFWKKSILPPDQNLLTTFKLDTDQLAQYELLTQKILRAYLKLPSTEIWNKDTLNTTLRQIETYHEMGVLLDKETPKTLYLSVLELIDHLESMASAGIKSMMKSAANLDCGEYKLYQNEIVSGDNTLLVEIGESKITYLNHSVLHFVGSMDKRFNEEVHGSIQNIIKRSSLMSGSGEKERTQVFNSLRKKVELKLNSVGS